MACNYSNCWTMGHARTSLRQAEWGHKLCRQLLSRPTLLVYLLQARLVGSLHIRVALHQVHYWINDLKFIVTFCRFTLAPSQMLTRIVRPLYVLHGLILHLIVLLGDRRRGREYHWDHVKWQYCTHDGTSCYGWPKGLFEWFCFRRIGEYKGNVEVNQLVLGEVTVR